MQTLTSAHPSFRYLWSSNRSDTSTPKYLAARNVLVGEAPPSLVGNWANGRAARLVQKLGLSKVSEFELEDLGETNSLVIRNLLRSVLQPVLGERSIRYLSTDYGAIVGGGLPYHHDMPYSNGIFGAWCIEGPPERTVRFGEMDIEVPFKPGTVVVFDPAQPHALLNGKRQFEETDYAPTDLVGMVGFVALRTPKACAALGIEAYGPKKHKGIRTTPNQFEACPRTGRIPGLAR